MLKSEILEMIKDIADDGDINDLLMQHEEIKGLTKPLDLSDLGIEEFKTLLASNKTIQAYNQSSLDSAISRGVESFKTKTMPTTIQEAVNKALKEKAMEGQDPTALELAELKKELAREKLVGKYTTVLANEGLGQFANFILNSSDEEVIKGNIEAFKSNIKPLVSSQVETVIKGGSYTPPKNQSPGGAVTKEQFSKMGYDARVKIFNENPELYEQLKK